jgi:hypothetical protein
MNAPTMPAGVLTTFAPLRVGVHALVAISIGIVSPFTGLAWPFALLVGMALGAADARRLRGEARDLAGESFTAVAVAGGILGMLFFGAIIGGLIAVVVVSLTAFSERAAAQASPTDRGVARILLFIVPVAMWLFLFPLLGMDVDIRIGG